LCKKRLQDQFDKLVDLIRNAKIGSHRVYPQFSNIMDKQLRKIKKHIESQINGKKKVASGKILLLDELMQFEESLLRLAELLKR